MRCSFPRARTPSSRSATRPCNRSGAWPFRGRLPDAHVRPCSFCGCARCGAGRAPACAIMGLSVSAGERRPGHGRASPWRQGLPARRRRVRLQPGLRLLAVLHGREPGVRRGNPVVRASGPVRHAAVHDSVVRPPARGLLQGARGAARAASSVVLRRAARGGLDRAGARRESGSREPCAGERARGPARRAHAGCLGPRAGRAAAGPCAAGGVRGLGRGRHGLLRHGNGAGGGGRLLAEAAAAGQRLGAPGARLRGLPARQGRSRCGRRRCGGRRRRPR